MVSTVPDYRPDKTPPIPLFSVPAIGVFASNADRAVIQAASSSLASVPSVTVSPVKYDGMSLVSGLMVLDGDGSAVSSSDKGMVADDGTGSGVITEDPISIICGGDGSGTYSNVGTMVTITIEADGSGTRPTTTTSIILGGNGGGNYFSANSMESIINNDDNPSQSSKGTVTVINNSGGTGSYSDEKLTTRNNDNGTATIGGITVNDTPRIERVSKFGRFPTVESLEPAGSCGTVIILEGGVLLDFGKSDVRPEAAQTLKSLVDVSNNAEIPTAHVYGYTDSISNEAFNLQLSQEYADAMSAGLRKDGVSVILDATSYGGSKSVAPDKNADSSDSLAGHALSHRVEIFILAF